MPDQQSDRQNLANLLQGFGQAALHAAGPPPIPDLPVGNVGTVPFDLAPITRAALGVNFDLKEDPKTLRAKLEHLLPAVKDPVTGRTTFRLRHGGADYQLMQSGWPMVGQIAVAAAALEALSSYADDALDQIKPFDCTAGDGRRHEPIVALIRTHIRRLEEQFASGRPLVPEVEALNEALLGYIDDLGQRCGIEPGPACTIEDEKILTRFIGLRAVAQYYRTSWDEVCRSSDSQFFLVAAQDIQRQLFATTLSLQCLRRLLPDCDLATAEVPNMPGVGIGAALHWMQSYCATTALEVLREGRDGLRSVHQTMKRFKDVLQNLLSGASGDQATSAEPCLDVPAAFGKEEVQQVLQELRCHIQRVIDITSPPAE